MIVNFIYGKSCTFFFWGRRIMYQFTNEFVNPQLLTRSLQILHMNLTFLCGIAKRCGLEGATKLYANGTHCRFQIIIQELGAKPCLCILLSIIF